MSENRFEQMFKKADEAFDKKYQSELDQLNGLSEDEIKALIPDTKALEVYKMLVAVVEEAQKENLLRSQVIQRIQALGESAVNVAKKVSGLKELL